MFPKVDRFILLPNIQWSSQSFVNGSFQNVPISAFKNSPEIMEILQIIPESTIKMKWQPS
jgi:hypothetical protein